MYFKNYKYFLAIVEYGGVTRAAEALFLSALSEQISAPFRAELRH